MLAVDTTVARVGCGWPLRLFREDASILAVSCPLTVPRFAKCVQVVEAAPKILGDPGLTQTSHAVAGTAPHSDWLTTAQRRLMLTECARSTPSADRLIVCIRVRTKQSRPPQTSPNTVGMSAVAYAVVVLLQRELTLPQHPHGRPALVLEVDPDPRAERGTLALRPLETFQHITAEP